MKLYLARHGEYAVENASQLDVLTEKGIKDIVRTAKLLGESQIKVAAIFHSGKHRAQQTAELLAQGVQCDQPPQIRKGLYPNDDVMDLSREISVWDEDVLLVGHLPFMGRLASQLLIGNQNKEIVDFQPGTIVCLEAIDTDRWLIRWMIAPVF